MRSDLAIKLAVTAALGLPCLAIAASGAPAQSLAVTGIVAAVLTAGLWLSPLYRSAAASAELERSLDRVEDDVRVVTEGWAEIVGRAHTAGRFREEFVAAVRHELKTPLNAILGFADILLDAVDGPLTERQREDVVAIRAAGGYLEELVDAVLLEWRPTRGTPLPMQYVDVRSMLHQIARLLEGQIGDREITIGVDLSGSVPRPLADERRLRQALINLGTNALRATAKGAVVFSAEEQGSLLRITVADTGTGIAADALPTLFSRFAQAGSTASREGGSGLGLHLAREMIEWHGGFLEVETKLGEGTRFSVFLRLDAE